MCPKMRRELLFLALLICSSLFPGCLGSPVQCSAGGSCTINDYEELWLDRTLCKVAEVACFSTEKELIHIVADAVKQGKKIKVISKGAHSTPKLVCPGGDQGVLVSTSQYATRITVDKKAKTATVDAGVTLRDFVAKIAKYGLTIPHTTSWSGLSMAGVVSTGAHGSSLWGKGSGIHERVVAITMVVPASAAEGYAKVIKLTAADEDFKAARISLGLLGVISQITFALEPMFKRSVTFELQNDTNLENTIIDFSKAHEFGYLTWFPSQKVVIYRKDDRVSVKTPGNGIFVGYSESHAAGSLSSKLKVEALEAAHDAQGICNGSVGTAAKRVQNGNNFRNDQNNSFTGYPVIGYSNLIQCAGTCGTNGNSSTSKTCPIEAAPINTNLCSFDKRLNGSLKFDVAISVSLAKLPDLIRDIKKMRDLNPVAMCIIDYYDGILMRFVKGTDAYLGPKVDVADVELWHHRYRELNVPGFEQDVMDEIEQLMVSKYGGLPHWGKNRFVAFDKIWDRLPDLNKFLAAKKKYDPQGLFSSEWSDSLLGLRGNSLTVVKDFCGLEGLCVCSQDKHCYPEKGYLCKTGLVLPSARVCRYSP